MRRMTESYNSNRPNKITWAVFNWITDTHRVVVQDIYIAAQHGGRRLRRAAEDLLLFDEKPAYGLETVLLTGALDTVDWEYLAEKLREE